jgi:hypothetical protein
MDKKYHWFCLTYFSGRNGIEIGTAYVGNIKKGVPRKQIDESKEPARVSKDAALIACSYLGYMTRDQFEYGDEFAEEVGDGQ